ncbi:hypothetical protein [Thermococcus gammatolerans]|uniref:Uncharacterized protein n=1 Tax=Thermococcus gammatolerans (strain DSM 15229 / JCM 11827 / EJ3) TaxID=593117 RepID=C5A7A8_THEGJ|nr:hypothetical protein [Thermococcus gammatolerans]ACS34120.1 Hypothetical protein TGAM_1618 [Thermococcus gammatolerans EJ3]
MERATLIIEKSIPPKTRAEVKELFKNTDTGRFKYIVVEWLAYWHYRNYKPPLIPLSVSLAAGLFKKRPKELGDEEFEAHHL